MSFRGHAHASTLLDGLVRGEGGLDTQAPVQLLDGAKHAAEGRGLFAACKEHRASSEPVGWRKAAGRGVARVVGGDLAPHGDEVASARSASKVESHASGCEGGDLGDQKGRRGGCSVADARGNGGGTHVQRRRCDCLPGCT
jgi:hypothetical protein